MKSDLDYTICPECMALNAAMWRPYGEKSYDVYCTVCGHEFEHGHYDSNDIVLMFDDLPDAHLHAGVDPESIGAILQEAQRVDFDHSPDIENDPELRAYLIEEGFIRGFPWERPDRGG